MPFMMLKLMLEEIQKQITQLDSKVTALQEELDRHNRIMGWQTTKESECPTKEEPNPVPNTPKEEQGEPSI